MLDLIDDAIVAINRVHTDRSVSLDETLERLRQLYEHVDFLILAVKEDIAREKHVR